MLLDMDYQAHTIRIIQHYSVVLVQTMTVLTTLVFKLVTLTQVVLTSVSEMVSSLVSLNEKYKKEKPLRNQRFFYTLIVVKSIFGNLSFTTLVPLNVICSP